MHMGENAHVRLRLLRNTKLLSFDVVVLILCLHKSTKSFLKLTIIIMTIIIIIIIINNGVFQ